jgi:hypothetical protein
MNISIKDITIKNSEYADIIIALDDKIEAINKSIEASKALNAESSIQFWTEQKERTTKTKERFREIARNIDRIVIL